MEDLKHKLIKNEGESGRRVLKELLLMRENCTTQK